MTFSSRRRESWLSFKLSNRLFFCGAPGADWRYNHNSNKCNAMCFHSFLIGSGSFPRQCSQGWSTFAAGYTIVVKPAEVTVLSALALAQAAEEAGVPPGGSLMSSLLVPENSRNLEAHLRRHQLGRNQRSHRKQCRGKGPSQASEFLLLLALTFEEICTAQKTDEG
ncbi:unnamed protein product [Cylicocyclus nassatus]|uniref:Aldehyde dehydrogenase domain-containing protein n=1 Tax=Cylicocyclus nassatus TaxID=53992 RepID=A0AA36GKA9_CYLNA|nr:unnamed protein product [Cylicocyclus nassatus]